MFVARELLWRGSLLPLGCEAAPSPPNPVHQKNRVGFATASPPSGSKRPRHKCPPGTKAR
ncbi:hypothetical protein C1X35_07575 [Pseudomonas sp. FW306-1C-G01A]|nr:hypothetical protein C1X56_07160 [Pseudomonas sp. GW101-1A09]PMV94696.1 hypothetical protein C1X51_12080 [Pseudomonas sp. FW306-2-2C-B10A]PMV98973.1 hypothetical protein C1X55_13570 [Pseudomonas sp. GW460-C8]PMW06444.1 hypothetical protein C1X50_08855 [Pseudomonas sp. MPR-TSA4]PMW15121.1 hypothetical protein C1X52_14345 [Pseudomonas sp. FW306-2-1A-C05A]PMW16982.1 hypothetical protein C1X40_18260 [Pseudomonas sp. GW456-11-11-14-TSB2]PMW39569.1 hypothetical protein C1X48_10670 [Pseudomonas s